MKKFTLIVAAVFMSSFIFAQVGKIDPSYVKKELVPTFVDDSKSGWVGGGFDVYYTGAVMGDHFFIAGSEFSEIEVGDEITKVKFFHRLGAVQFSDGPVTFTNTTYTVKIFESPVLGGDYASIGLYDTNIGTPVYQQSVTLGQDESNTNYELTLTTPYEVTSTPFWVAISFDNGKGAMKLGATGNDSNEGKYYMYYTEAGYGTFIVDTDFGSATVADFRPLAISLMVDDGTPYVQTSDLTAVFLDRYPTPTNYLTTLRINATEDLVIYPAIENDGPDATDSDATFTITINGTEIFGGELDLSSTPDDVLAPGFYLPLPESIEGQTLVFTKLTAAEMNAMGLSTVGGTFNVVFTVTYAGTDNNLTNNTVTLVVTRGTVDVPTNHVNNVSVYPNPSNGEVNVLVSENSVVKLIDMTGRIIETYKVNANSALNFNQSAGAYFLQIESNGKVETQKLIIK